MENPADGMAALAADREITIVRTSIIGILTNLLLVGFKAFVGFVSNSIAVILDAVNNLSDALSTHHLIELGICPQWECGADNEASAALAKSIGYEEYGRAYILEEPLTEEK